MSEKHCGFIINTGNATAEDVKRRDLGSSEKSKRAFSGRPGTRDQIPVRQVRGAYEICSSNRHERRGEKELH